jgi:hypothetical protein
MLNGLLEWVKYDREYDRPKEWRKKWRHDIPKECKSCKQKAKEERVVQHAKRVLRY